MTDTSIPNDHVETGDSPERDAIEETLQGRLEEQEAVKSAIAIYRDKISQIKQMEREAKIECDREIEKIIEAKEQEGWRKFVFDSYYFGNHRDQGDGDIKITFLFAPGIDFSQWEKVSFEHGTHGQTQENDEFEEWLSTIPKDKCIEIPIEGTGGL
jgi:hypothetical protein